MDVSQFDRIARTVAGARSRRLVLQSAGGLVATAAPGGEFAGARRKRKKKPVCLNGQTIKASSDKRKKLIKQGATAGACTSNVCSQGACQPCTVTCTGSPVLCGATLSQALLAGGTVVVCPGRYAGGFSISQDTVLVGAGAGDDPSTQTILDGQGIDRVLLVKKGMTLSLAGVRVVNGASGTENGGGLATENDNDVRVADCAFVGNTGYLGGGLSAGKSLRVTSSTFSGNTAAFYGGAIYFSGETCLISATDFSSNSAASKGGAIYRSTGVMTLSSTTFNNNQPTDCAGEDGFTC